MINRISSRWNTLRLIYLVVGIFVIVISVAEKQWAGLLPGAYFAAMAIFNFGCAAGGCYTSPAKTKTGKKGTAGISFEEVK